MKLQIDTNKKTIKFEDNIKISKLIKTLKTLLPKDWKEYAIETNFQTTQWVEPFYFNHWGYYNVPAIDPSPSYTITYCGTCKNINKGSYTTLNIEI